jgi:putative membrane protein
MLVAARFLTGIVALEHCWFLVLEVFLWTRPTGRRTFGTTAEFAATTAPMMKNQGTYNGFLAAGLVWAIVATNRELAFFFLSCVLIAACVGGLTVKRSILFVQGLPAAVALGSWLLLG